MYLFLTKLLKMMQVRLKNIQVPRPPPRQLNDPIGFLDHPQILTTRSWSLHTFCGNFIKIHP